MDTELRDGSSSGSGSVNYVFTANRDYVQFNRVKTGSATLVFDFANQKLLNGSFECREVSLDNPSYNYKNISFNLGTMDAGLSSFAAYISISGSNLCDPNPFCSYPDIRL